LNREIKKLQELFN